jgi:hypothetical protein
VFDEQLAIVGAMQRIADKRNSCFPLKIGTRKQNPHHKPLNDCLTRNGAAFQQIDAMPRNKTCAPVAELLRTKSDCRFRQCIINALRR